MPSFKLRVNCSLVLHIVHKYQDKAAVQAPSQPRSHGVSQFVCATLKG